jgi:hypothetical protein
VTGHAPAATFGKVCGLAVDPIGPLPVQRALPPAVIVPGSPPMYCLGRMAIGPSGEAVGLFLQTPIPTRIDNELLDHVGAELELVNLLFEDDPSASMKAAGIRFEVPVGARFVAPRDENVPRVRMMGGAGSAAWYLDVYRVPLLGGRTPKALIKDHLAA